ncbi:MAG: hypothetical protein JEY96_03905 [Bacteroidales bacterium]|nr:hypothetical protein [Bacteroidales bacterium]
MDVEIDFIPFSFEMLETMEINDFIIDEENAYVENFVSIEERESFFKRLKGTIGKNIDFNP